MQAIEGWLIDEIAANLGLPTQAVSAKMSLAELGADSLLIISLIAAIADTWHIEVSADTLAGNTSITQLAHHVYVASEAATRPEGDEGRLDDEPLPLSPCQAWIVETAHFQAPHHWNLPVMLTSDQAINPQLVTTTLCSLVQRFPALRLRIRSGGNDITQWQQRFDGDEQIPVRVADLRQIDPNAIRATIEADAAVTQTTLNLESGPTIQAIVYNTPSGMADRLFLCMHHFLIDGFSALLLMREFEAAYLAQEQQRSTRPSSLPQSYTAWIRQLEIDAHSISVQAEMPFWLDMLNTPTGAVPFDHADDRNLEGDARSLHVALDSDASQRVLDALASPANVRLEAVMLLAIEQAFTRWSGSLAPLIDIQRHGRSQTPSGIRAERVIGWTNDVFPFALPPRAASCSGGLRRAVELQQRLDAVPELGRGYGLLRYLGTAQNREALCARPRAQVKLLCHSRLTQAGRATDKRFRLSDEDPGLSYGPQIPARYALLVYATLIDQHLRIDVAYGSGHFEEASVQRFIDDLKDALSSTAWNHDNSASDQEVLDP